MRSKKYSCKNLNCISIWHANRLEFLTANLIFCWKLRQKHFVALMSTKKEEFLEIWTRHKSTKARLCNLFERGQLGEEEHTESLANQLFNKPDQWNCEQNITCGVDSVTFNLIHSLIAKQIYRYFSLKTSHLIVTFNEISKIDVISDLVFKCKAHLIRYFIQMALLLLILAIQLMRVKSIVSPHPSVTRLDLPLAPYNVKVSIVNWIIKTNRLLKDILSKRIGRLPKQYNDAYFMSECEYYMWLFWDSVLCERLRQQNSDIWMHRL